MLQRDRQIRTQVHQLADAFLFATSFWLAFALRSNLAFTNWPTGTLQFYRLAVP